MYKCSKCYCIYAHAQTYIKCILEKISFTYRYLCVVCGAKCGIVFLKENFFEVEKCISNVCIVLLYVLLCIGAERECVECVQYTFVYLFPEKLLRWIGDPQMTLACARIQSSAPDDGAENASFRIISYNRIYGIKGVHIYKFICSLKEITL